MIQIADWIRDTLAHVGDDAALDNIAGKVREMAAGFPAPGIRIQGDE